MEFKTINWVAICAWAIGIAIAQLVPGIVPLNALIGTAAVYFVLSKVFSSKFETEKVTQHDY